VYFYCRNIWTTVKTLTDLVAFSVLYREYWSYVVLVFLSCCDRVRPCLYGPAGFNRPVVHTSGCRWMNIESWSPVRRHDALSTTNLTYTYFSGTESRPSWCDIDDRPNELWYSLLVFTHLKQKFKLHAQESWLSLQLVTCTSVLLDVFLLHNQKTLECHV